MSRKGDEWCPWCWTAAPLPHRITCDRPVHVGPGEPREIPKWAQKELGLMNIVEVAEKRGEIVAAKRAMCPMCGEDYYSPFDKLFIAAYEKCTLCCDDDAELERLGENIFAIIEML